MEKNNPFCSPPVFVFLSLLLASCSLDYSQAALPEDLADTVPETIILKFKQTNVNERKVKQLLEADRAESFTKSKKTIFQNLHYSEFDSEGVKVVEGKASEVVYQTESEDAEISGNVWFHSYSEKTSIYAESLSWKNKEKILTSGPDQLVRVIKEDGSFMQGTGFETDLRLKQVVFSRGVTGKYIKEDETEAKDGITPGDVTGESGR